jgi:hypothetical protein
MNTYRIAELKLNMKVKGKILKGQSTRYLSDKSAIADITIDIGDDYLEVKQKENSHLSIDECEYIWTGSEFYHKLLDFNGFMLHASAVAINNKAYLFSAKSGTGKSTHTELWQKHFGEDRAIIVNDDKPAIRFIDNQFYVYGTPWSGKSDKNHNIKVPLKAIVFIERSETNWINRIDSKQALKLIFDQTLRPKQLTKVDKLFTLVDELLKTIPIYKMGCNISEDAVRLAYETIKA